MRPQLPELLSEGLEVQSDEHDTCQEEEEEPLLDVSSVVVLLPLLEHFDHLLEERVKLAEELVIVAREYEESDSLHGVAFLNNYSIIVDEEAALEIPFLHLLFEDFIRLSIDEVLHDLLPLPHIEHTRLEEVLVVEKFDDVLPVWLDEAGVDRVGLFNNRGEEFSEEFIHDFVVGLHAG